MRALRKETPARVAEKRLRIVKWTGIKDIPPADLKISPITAIPHQSRDFYMILDLSFVLKVLDNELHSVNHASNKNLAPHHAMYELGNVITQIIHEMAVAPAAGVSDSFLGLIQSTNEAEIKRFTRCILQGITDSFHQPELTGGTMEPLSWEQN